MLPASRPANSALKAIRCGRGLGDSIYLQSVARHLVETRGIRLEVRSDYPDVFRPLGNSVVVTPFSREGIQIMAHYSMRKNLQGTTQFQDCCGAAGITEPVKFFLDWPRGSGPYVDKVLAPGRPVVCVQLPRYPMGREDGYGLDLLPDCKAIQRLIDGLQGKATLVQIGAGQQLFRFKGIDIDLANQTTVAEMLDVASVATGFLGYCSFILPLAESLDKPVMLVWSRKGLKSGNPFISSVTPAKLLHKETSMTVLDNATDEQQALALEKLKKAIGL